MNYIKVLNDGLDSIFNPQLMKKTDRCPKHTELSKMLKFAELERREYC